MANDSIANEHGAENLQVGVFAHPFNASWFFVQKKGAKRDRNLDLVVPPDKHLFSDTGRKPALATLFVMVDLETRPGRGQEGRKPTLDGQSS